MTTKDTTGGAMLMRYADWLIVLVGGVAMVVRTAVVVVVVFVLE
jgi:hypothetical protein